MKNHIINPSIEVFEYEKNIDVMTKTDGIERNKILFERLLKVSKMYQIYKK